MFVLTFYQDIYLSFLFLFRFRYVDDQLLLELLLKVGCLYLWIAFNAKKDMNYNKKTEGRRGCLNTGYHKTVQSSPSLFLYKVATGKKIQETCVQRCLWGEGRGRVCVNWKTPQKFKSIPTFVHDCSLPSSSLLCTVLVSRISES